MNQGRIWCVVNPTVGLPLFLGSVALTSLAVHTAVMTHTTWMSTYWQGAKARVAMDTATPAKAASAFAMTVTPVPATAAAPASFVITFTPNGITPGGGTTATASEAAIAPHPLHVANAKLTAAD